MDAQLRRPASRPSWSSGPPGNPYVDTGDLSLAIDTTRPVGTATDLDRVGFKDYVDGQFTSGPVVSTLRSGSANLTVAGAGQLDGGQHGVVTLNVAASRDFDLLPIDTQLFGATIEAYGMTIALGLPNGRNTSFVTSFYVPASVPVDSPRAIYPLVARTGQLDVTGRVDRENKTLRGSGRDTARRNGRARSRDRLHGGHRPMRSGTYLQVRTDPILVAGGEMIYLRIARAGSTDGLASELKVMKHYGKFEITE